MRKVWYYISHWESWHWFAKYILISPVWIWLSIKARSPWFFSAANPGITFSGYVGETKEEIYRQLPPRTLPNSVFIKQPILFEDVLQKIEGRIQFPMIAKPNAGLMGFMFRKIDNVGQLKQYHAAMTADYIIQEYVTYPLEVSVFYYRYPGQSKGTITGFLKKEFLEVTGDGKSTLLELILQYPRVQFRIDEMKSKHAPHLNKVIADGETYLLSHALNLSRGGKLVSLAKEKDESLQKLFDELSHYSGFHYGRYDIRCNSVEDLKEGKNYFILEFNGCGGEPHHVYGDGNSLWKACRILIHHWYQMFGISQMNRKAGVPLWEFSKGWTHFKKSTAHLRRMKKLDHSFVFTPDTSREESSTLRQVDSPAYKIAANTTSHGVSA